MKEKLPYVKWFFSDWISDTRGLSLEAKGAWMDILSLLHDGDPYGHLAVNGKERSIESVARIIGTTPKILKPLIDEMEENGLFSRSEEGVIFSRRMVRENYLRKVRGGGGFKGGNPSLKESGKVDDKDNLPPNLPHQMKDNLTSNHTDNLSSESKDNLPPNLPLVRALVVQSPESRVQSPERGKSARKQNLPDDAFIEALKANPAYSHIDIDRELAKMDAWLLTPKGRGRKKTRQFIVNWLNKIDVPVQTKQNKPEFVY